MLHATRNSLLCLSTAEESAVPNPSEHRGERFGILAGRKNFSEGQ
jgi:hypothetical protein